MRAGSHYWHHSNAHRELITTSVWSLSELCRTLEIPGANRLCDPHATLDSAARTAYAIRNIEDMLDFLLTLSLESLGKKAKVASLGGTRSQGRLPCRRS